MALSDLRKGSFLQLGEPQRAASDITKRKWAEEALRQKTAELAYSEAEKEQLELFAQLASHDLQAPLQKIIGFGDLLEEHIGSTLDERGRHLLEKIKEGARRMCLLMDGLVDFARVVTREESFKPVNLNDVLRGVLLDLEMRILQSGARVEVDDPLPTLDADKTQMREVLHNLVSNALKFHKKGRPPRVRIRGRVFKDGRVGISIEDNGIGFDEKYVDRIFKPFERLCRREDFEGMGIGLPICRKIILRHNGEIKVQSAPGKGSIFTVILPNGRKE
jgi:signal transduction histidine kinase